MADIEDNIKVLGDRSAETLRAYFEDSDPDKADLARAKIAASVFSSVIRLQQTLGARDALTWSKATYLLDKDQVREYIRVSQPGSPLVKALPERTASP